MKTELKTTIIICFLMIYGSAHSQEVSHPVVNTGVYEFLDELASEQIIEINSAVKPYSRLFIANKLSEADQQREVLNIRQQRELDFYLLDFGKEIGRVGKRESGRIAITMPADDSSSIGQQSAVKIGRAHV